MKRLEVSGAVRPIYGSLGVKRLIKTLQYYNIELHEIKLSYFIHKELRNRPIQCLRHPTRLVGQH